MRGNTPTCAQRSPLNSFILENIQDSSEYWDLKYMMMEDDFCIFAL